jgi:hypothetical protein
MVTPNSSSIAMISSTLSKPMTIQAGEHPRSAARDHRLTTPPDFIASPLHRFVRL